MWSVHGSNRTCDDEAADESWHRFLQCDNARAHAICWKSLTTKGAICEGEHCEAHDYLYVNKIVWSDGMIWNRLHISPIQTYLLTHRPYVPATIIFICSVRVFVEWCAARVQSCIAYYVALTKFIMRPKKSHEELPKFSL